MDLSAIFRVLLRRYRLVALGVGVGLLLSSAFFVAKKDEPGKIRLRLDVDLAKAPKICPFLSNSGSFSVDSLCHPSIEEGTVLKVFFDFSKRLKNKYPQEWKNISDLNIGLLEVQEDVVAKDVVSIGFLVDAVGEPALKSRMQGLQAEIRSLSENSLGYMNSYASQMPDVARKSNIDAYVINSSTQWTSIYDANEGSSYIDIRIILMGLMSGFVSGCFLALWFDRKCGFVFEVDKLSAILARPSVLRLPSYPWFKASVQPLIHQLSIRLSPDLEWRVLSIAKNHAAVEPLANLLKCLPGSPLLLTTLEPSKDGLDLGVLLVLEPGFNTFQALEEARLLLEQMPNVSDVYLIILGIPFPDDLMGA